MNTDTIKRVGIIGAGLMGPELRRYPAIEDTAWPSPMPYRNVYG